LSGDGNGAKLLFAEFIFHSPVKFGFAVTWLIAPHSTASANMRKTIVLACIRCSLVELNVAFTFSGSLARYRICTRRCPAPKSHRCIETAHFGPAPGAQRENAYDSG